MINLLVKQRCCFSESICDSSVIEKTSWFESLELFSLIASDDVLAGSPNFVFEVLQMDQDY
jgi:hypothetical protein